MNDDELAEAIIAAEENLRVAQRNELRAYQEERSERTATLADVLRTKKKGRR